MLRGMSNTNIYEVTPEDLIEKEVVNAPVEVIEPEPIESVVEGEQPLTLEQKIDLIGNQLNWLCENLAQVFGVVQSLSQNGGGVRGLMQMMKGMKDNG